MKTMSKEKASTKTSTNVAAGSDWKTVFMTADLYKRSQGRVARQITGAALGAAAVLGAWRMSVTFLHGGIVWHILLPVVFMAAGLWISFRLMNIPRFADFLIATEAEMKKVSWPTRGELFRGSAVVLFTIFSLTAVLFLYDIFWQRLLSILGVLG